ncbi:hypothetical protein ACCO45_011071 [Purpureocillium lilacinum]|uniref:Uncharacterized protein n=1 Tax=Purpureocillium lilacinum TaxID=33203 RepID=A0ACC4DJK9_PURLI
MQVGKARMLSRELNWGSAGERLSGWLATLDPGEEPVKRKCGSGRVKRDPYNPDWAGRKAGGVWLNWQRPPTGHPRPPPGLRDSGPAAGQPWRRRARLRQVEVSSQELQQLVPHLQRPAVPCRHRVTGGPTEALAGRRPLVAMAFSWALWPVEPQYDQAPLAVRPQHLVGWPRVVLSRVRGSAKAL